MPINGHEWHLAQHIEEGRALSRGVVLDAIGYAVYIHLEEWTGGYDPHFVQLSSALLHQDHYGPIGAVLFGKYRYLLALHPDKGGYEAVLAPLL